MCQNAIAAPNHEIVQDFVSTTVLGAHHIPVADNDDSVLEPVLCENMSAKCMAVEVDEAFADFYLTAMIDVNCT